MNIDSATMRSNPETPLDTTDDNMDKTWDIDADLTNAIDPKMPDMLSSPGNIVSQSSTITCQIDSTSSAITQSPSAITQSPSDHVNKSKKRKIVTDPQNIQEPQEKLMQEKNAARVTVSSYLCQYISCELTLSINLTHFLF